MTNKHQKSAIQVAIFVLIALPVLSFLAGLVAWLMYGMDLPFFDDWRVLDERTATSLQVADLFRPANDTIYATGRALDALAQRYLNGNSVAYQFLSMLVILGGLLFLQYHLLSKFAHDQLTVAAAFSSTLLMLQPGSYWGFENLAYHQAIPVAALLLSVALIFNDRWRSSWGVPLVISLSVAAGFAYISGAFAVASAATVLFLYSFRCLPSRRRNIRAGAVAFAAGAVITLPVQLWVILVAQHGKTHRPDAPWAYPWQPEFWFFLLGKVARALGLQTTFLVPALLITLLILGIAVWIFAAIVVRGITFRDRHVTEAEGIYCLLFVVIGVYLFLVTSGRANLGTGGGSGSLLVFANGFGRFHFFWVTLLWPWLIALCLHDTRVSRTIELTVISTLVVFWGLASRYGSTFAHFESYSRIASWRADTQMSCLQEGLSKGVVECPDLYPAKDLTPIIDYARSIGASFARYLPNKSIPIGSDNPPPMFRLSSANLSTIRFSGGQLGKTSTGQLIFAGERDPQIILHLDPAAAQSCRGLELAAHIAAAQSDTAQMFFVRAGETGFTEERSVVRSYNSSLSGGREIRLRVSSESGFEPILRFDPGNMPQAFALSEVVVRCYRQ